LTFSYPANNVTARYPAFFWRPNMKIIWRCLFVVFIAGEGLALPKKIVKDWRAEKAVLDKQGPISNPGEVRPTNMILVAGGTFTMGDTWSAGIPDALPAHSVTLGTFEMSECEITQDEMARVMNWACKNGKIFIKDGLVKNRAGKARALIPANEIGWSGESFEPKAAGLPCQLVTWYGAAAYCNYRSEMEGMAPCYTQTLLGRWECNFEQSGYRLPTEAEWEYAARGGPAGLHTKYSGGEQLEDVGWYKGNNGTVTVYVNEQTTKFTKEFRTERNESGENREVEITETHQATELRPHTIRKGSVQYAGNKKANELGLYDMSGNVSEWCNDLYGKYANDPENNPVGPPYIIGRKRYVRRGGSYRDDAVFCRVDTRSASDPDKSGGFRVVRRAGGDTGERL
jgi:formylglycine-generating enzyme required for sulfatase activity